jgi:hypothetical protein
MSNHSIRVDDQLWQSAMGKATMNGTTMTSVITGSLREYVSGGWNPPREVFARLETVDALEERVEALEQRGPMPRA